MTEAPFISVVVPTHNRPGLLAGCLSSVVALDYPRDRYEVLVIDANSADDTSEVVARIAAGAAPEVRCLRLSSSDANAARNAGIEAARGDLVSLIDDDVIVPPGWLRALAEGAARHPAADCLGGPVRPLFESAPPRTCERHELAGARFDEGGLEKEVQEVWGGNMAIRPRAVERAGPFRQGLRVQQEWEWEQRLLAAGGRMVYLPAAWLSHRRGAADVRLGAMVREHFVRGRTKAALGQAVAPRVAAQAARFWLLHALRRRCTRGLTESARNLGSLWGALRPAAPARTRRSPRPALQGRRS